MKRLIIQNYKTVIRILLAVYLVAVLWITLIGREKSHSVNMLTRPFWEYIEFFRNPSWYTLHDIVMNMVLFIPFGILLPLTNLSKSFKFTVFSALILSAFIEFSQLIFKLGWCEIDDMFNNTAGACIGFFVYKLVYMIKMRRSE